MDHEEMRNAYLRAISWAHGWWITEDKPRNGSGRRLRTKGDEDTALKELRNKTQRRTSWGSE